VPSSTGTLLGLTFVTGIVDAVSFLALGQVFVAMQTGNVIFLGLGIAGAPNTHVAGPLIAIVCFVAAGAVAATFARRAAEDEVVLGRAIVIEIPMLAAAAVLAALAAPSPGEWSAYVLIAIASAAMGARTTLARAVGGPNLATTVLNLTVTMFAAHVPLATASSADIAQRAAAFAAIAAGAVSGALLVKTSVALALGVAAALTCAAGVAHLATRRPRERPAG
jgi:uncharacterized membrane protein YoaK (UPF0700 family)